MSAAIVWVIYRNPDEILWASEYVGAERDVRAFEDTIPQLAAAMDAQCAYESQYNVWVIHRNPDGAIMDDLRIRCYRHALLDPNAGGSG